MRIRHPRAQDKYELGILLSRTYLAYEAKNCMWKVLVGGEIRALRESCLSLDKKLEGDINEKR